MPGQFSKGVTDDSDGIGRHNPRGAAERTAGQGLVNDAERERTGTSHRGVGHHNIGNSGELSQSGQTASLDNQRVDRTV